MPMTLVTDAFTILECFTSVNDTAEEFLTGVNETRNVCFAVINDNSNF